MAALFAVHPLHVESVAWITERKDVLSLFFGLLSLSAYVRYAQTRRLAPYALSIICFAGSLLSKQTLVTLPFVLLLLDYWPLKRLASGPQRCEDRRGSGRSRRQDFGMRGGHGSIVA